MPVTTNPRTRAFTLIELLVVVAIIAVLIAILLPSLSKSRELARTTVCGTKMRAWGQAFLMYANEFGGAIPLDGGDGTSSVPVGVWTDSRLWFNGLTSYMGSGSHTYYQLQLDALNSGDPYKLPKGGANSFFVCPSATDAQSNNAETGDTVTNGLFVLSGYPFPNSPNTVAHPMLLCYGMNSQLRSKDYSNWQTVSNNDVGAGDISNITRLRPAAPIPLLAEKRIRQDELPANDANYTKAMAQTKVTANRFTARHKKGGNIVFADGHVGWLENLAINKGTGTSKTNFYNINDVVIWNPTPLKF